MSYQDYRPTGGTWGTAPQQPSYPPPSEAPPPPFPASPGTPPTPQPSWGAQPHASAGYRQRPGLVALAATLTVTASLQFMAVLGFAWLLARVGRDEFNENTMGEGAIFHLLERFDLGLTYGRWIPLFGLPLAATVVGLMLLSGGTVVRLVHSALAVTAIVAVIVMFGQHALMAASAIGYIVVAAAVMWHPAVTAWYRHDPRARVW